MNNRKIFGDNLRKYRAKSGMTQQEVANKLEIERSTYTKYETAVSEPSFDMLQRIANVFNTDFNNLFEDKS